MRSFIYDDTCANIIFNIEQDPIHVIEVTFLSIILLNPFVIHYASLHIQISWVKQILCLVLFCIFVVNSWQNFKSFFEFINFRLICLFLSYFYDPSSYNYVQNHDLLDIDINMREGLQCNSQQLYVLTQLWVLILLWCQCVNSNISSLFSRRFYD